MALLTLKSAKPFLMDGAIFGTHTLANHLHHEINAQNAPVIKLLSKGKN